MSTILKQFIKNPQSTGAVLPSSRFLADAITNNIGLEKAQNIVELGPGTGPFTKMILDKKSKDAKFFAVELNEHLVDVLKKTFPDLTVYNDSATELPKLLKREHMKSADVIVSGLPWASFPKSLQKDILDAVLESLSPNGYFVTFAYLQGVLLPTGKNFKKLLHHSFSSVEKSPTVWRNSPPAFVYRCRR